MAAATTIREKPTCGITCGICLENIEELLPHPNVSNFDCCGHKFHFPCIKPWLDAKHDTCPMDRNKITSVNGVPLVNEAADGTPAQAPNFEEIEARVRALLLIEGISNAAEQRAHAMSPLPDLLLARRLYGGRLYPGPNFDFHSAFNGYDDSYREGSGFGRTVGYFRDFSGRAQALRSQVATTARRVISAANSTFQEISIVFGRAFDRTANRVAIFSAALVAPTQIPTAAASMIPRIFRLSIFGY